MIVHGFCSAEHLPVSPPQTIKRTSPLTAQTIKRVVLQYHMARARAQRAQEQQRAQRAEPRRKRDAAAMQRRRDGKQAAACQRRRSSSKRGEGTDEVGWTGAGDSTDLMLKKIGRSLIADHHEVVHVLLSAPRGKCQPTLTGACIMGAQIAAGEARCPHAVASTTTTRDRSFPPCCAEPPRSYGARPD